MSENYILIEGKEYISSDRAAKLVGYTKDYVGQLARAGKIKSKRIGRSWYIEEESINKHKLSVHYILTKPKKNFTKSLTNVAENRTKNIDISSNYNEQFTKSSVESNHEKGADFSKNTHFESDESVDLLPKIRQKSNDVLLHSDIKYEKVDNPQATYANRNFSDKSDSSHNSYKDVSIRTNVLKRTPQDNTIVSHRNPARELKSVGLSNKPRIDGIITTTPRKQTYSQMPLPVRQHTSLQPRKYADELPEREYPKKVYRENREETSKIVPVIGGIVLFTIFVVVYILFSLD